MNIEVEQLKELVEADNKQIQLITNEALCALLNKAAKDFDDKDFADLALQIERSEFLILRAHHFTEETNKKLIDNEEKLRSNLLAAFEVEFDTAYETLIANEGIRRYKMAIAEIGVRRKLTKRGELIAEELKFNS